MVRALGLALLLVLGSGGPALAQAEPSVVCATQLVRFMAIRSGSAESASPQTLYEVASDGVRRGRMSGLAIKRALAKGELPATTLVWRPGEAWTPVAAQPDLAPLPAVPASPQLPGLAMGCWVSDPHPFQEGPVTFLFLLDGHRGFYYAVFLNDANADGELLWLEYGHPYEIRDINGAEFSVAMPGTVELSQDITGFSGIAARMIGQDTLEVRANGGLRLTFRRM